MNRILFLKMIEEYTDTENFYEKAKELGKKASQADIKRSQISNLENVANSTFKVSDIIDYIKKQTARPGGWQKGVGDELLDFINGDVSMISKKIKENIKNDFNEDAKLREIQLQLLREFIHSFAVNYEYYDMKRRRKNESLKRNDGKNI